jgi:pyridoxal phosphate enzyme (YggS family)
MIADNLQGVISRISAAAARAGRPPGSVRLLAASKTHPPARIAEAFEAGQRTFGENYVQEALEKMDAMAQLLGEERARGLEWHLIGPLQSNKTRAAAERFDWVQSIDREKIARRLSEQRPAALAPLNVLIEVNLSGEASKSGVGVDGALALARAVAGLGRLRLRGLMAIPAPSDDEAQQRAAFRAVRELFERLRAQGLDLDTLSMGMSDDMEAAIEEGATMVRIGSAIFGPRETVRSAA